MLTRYLNIKEIKMKRLFKPETIIPIGITLPIHEIIIPISGIIRQILHQKNARAVRHHLVGLLVVPIPKPEKYCLAKGHELSLLQSKRPEQVLLL